MTVSSRVMIAAVVDPVGRKANWSEKFRAAAIKFYDRLEKSRTSVIRNRLSYTTPGSTRTPLVRFIVDWLSRFVIQQVVQQIHIKSHQQSLSIGKQNIVMSVSACLSVCTSVYSLSLQFMQFIVMLLSLVFTVRRLAKRGICRRRVSVCLSVCVCVCVCLSHSGIVSKRLNVGSRK